MNMNNPVSLIMTPPHWCPNATPTKRGWVNPINGELLVGTKFIDPSLYSKHQNNEQIKEIEIVEVTKEVENVGNIEIVSNKDVEVKDSIKQPKPKKQSFLEKIKGNK